MPKSDEDGELLAATNTIHFTNKWVILCEGWGDKGFFINLIKKRNLPEFQIIFPRQFPGDTGGWTKFGRFLSGVSTQEDFLTTVKAILIVADNDSNPAERFNEIRKQIASAGYNAPTSELTASTTDNLPAIVVAMLPLGGVSGSLETVCLEAAYSKWPDLKNPLDGYISQAPAAKWPNSKHDKARIDCLLAATCEQDPTASLATLWTRKPDQYHIPTDHKCFDPIAKVLNDFGTLVP